MSSNVGLVRSGNTTAPIMYIGMLLRPSIKSLFFLNDGYLDKSDTSCAVADIWLIQMKLGLYIRNV